MTQSRVTVSESEAVERLEELIVLALQGHEVIIEADTGGLIAHKPVNDEAE